MTLLADRVKKHVQAVTAAPLPESQYSWFRYNGKPTTITTRNGKHSARLTPGSMFGMRSSTSVKGDTRVITKELGPTIVFSFDATSVPFGRIRKDSEAVKGSGGKAAVPAKKAAAVPAKAPAKKASAGKSAADMALLAKVQKRLNATLEKVIERYNALTDATEANLLDDKTFAKAKQKLRECKLAFDVAQDDLDTISRIRDRD